MSIFDARAFLRSIQSASETLTQPTTPSGTSGFDGIGLMDSIMMSGQLEQLDAARRATPGAPPMNDLPLAIVRPTTEPV